MRDPESKAIWTELAALPGFARLHARLQQDGPAAWLVGGGLRDWLLGQPLADVDLVVDGDCEPLARWLAAAEKGSWFWLDRERGQCRVVLEYATGGRFGYDLAPLKGGSLQADLRERDFTINAMALPLGPAGARLFDPFGGLQDLNDRRLRVTTSASLRQDPLRVLRGLRFLRVFGLACDPPTFELMCRMAPAMADLPGERIAGELSRILCLPLPPALLTMFEQLQLFVSLGLRWPELPAGRVMRARIRMLEAAVAALPEDVSERQIAGGWNAAALVRLHLLRPASGEDGVRALTTRLKLPRIAGRALLGLHRLERRLLPPLPAGERRRRLWLQQLPGHPLCCLLQIMAFASLEGAGAGTQAALAADALALADGDAPAPLVPAGEIARELNIPPGPLLGKLLERLVAAEIAGQVNDRATALVWLKKELELGIDKAGGPP